MKRLLFKKRVIDRLLFFGIADILVIILSVYLAFLLRFDGEIPTKYLEEGTLQGMIILSLIFCLPIFSFFRLYSFSWSYVSTSELVALAKAIGLSFIFITVSLFMLRTFKGFPRSTLFISYFLIFIFSGGIRFSKRIYLNILKNKKGKTKKERTLIVGAGDAGEQILRSILNFKESHYLPIGFVDDNLLKQGIIIHGLNILGRIKDIPDIVRDYRVEGLIVALPSAGSEGIKKAVEMGRKSGLKKIKIVPSLGEIMSKEISIRSIREVQVEDLLGREQIKLDTKSIEDFIRNKKVLITGAAGSIGSELSKQVAKFKPSLLLLLDQDETGIFNISRALKDNFPYLNIKALIIDIREEEKINQIFSQSHPDIVFHAAAYKHVPLMEKQPREAVENNIFGTKIVVDACLNYGVEKFVFISTDKAVNPTSIMGATKRIGEMICQASNRKSRTKFISVRFGNVLDSRGSVIPIFRQQIKKGKAIEVTHSQMKRYFMITSEAVLLVMQAGAMGQGEEVFVLDMGKPIRIIELAKEMVRLSGFEPDKDIPIIYTEPRPGEKFFEEILTAEEGTVATQNQKIFRAKLSEINEERLQYGLSGLKQAATRSDKNEMVNIFKKLIPFYES